MQQQQNGHPSRSSSSQVRSPMLQEPSDGQFPCFSELPAEIRREIWSQCAAAEEPRVIEFFAGEDIDTNMLLNMSEQFDNPTPCHTVYFCDHKACNRVPAIAHACIEARQVVFERCRWFTTPCGRRILFNPAADWVVYAQRRHQYDSEVYIAEELDDVGSLLSYARSHQRILAHFDDVRYHQRTKAGKRASDLHEYRPQTSRLFEDYPGAFDSIVLANGEVSMCREKALELSLFGGGTNSPVLIEVTDKVSTSRYYEGTLRCFDGVRRCEMLDTPTSRILGLSQTLPAGVSSSETMLRAVLDVATERLEPDLEGSEPTSDYEGWHRGRHDVRRLLPGLPVFERLFVLLTRQEPDQLAAACCRNCFYRVLAEEYPEPAIELPLDLTDEQVWDERDDWDDLLFIS